MVFFALLNLSDNGKSNPSLLRKYFLGVTQLPPSCLYKGGLQ